MDGGVWQRRAAMIICLIGGGLLLYYGIRFCLGLFLPFFLAWGISVLIRPPARKLSHWTGIPYRICSVFLLILLVAFLFFLLFAALHRGLYELRRLPAKLLEDGSNIEALLDRAVVILERIGGQLGLWRFWGDGVSVEDVRVWLYARLSGIADDALSSLTARIPRWIGWILSALPGGILVGIVTAISGVYFCMDGERITASLLAILPSRWRSKLPLWRQGIRRFSWQYLRAYLILTLLTFLALFLGFSILRMDYAFLLAIAVALIDLLPILGVGTVLLPWAAVLLIGRHFYLGFGLLILYFTVLLLRQILEPRLIGKSLGLHPLLTLFASYAGWRLLGFTGMILAPILAMIGKNFLAGGISAKDEGAKK